MASDRVEYLEKLVPRQVAAPGRLLNEVLRPLGLKGWELSHLRPFGDDQIWVILKRDPEAAEAMRIQQAAHHIYDVNRQRQQTTARQLAQDAEFRRTADAAYDALTPEARQALYDEAKDGLEPMMKREAAIHVQVRRLLFERGMLPAGCRPVEVGSSSE